MAKIQTMSRIDEELKNAAEIAAEKENRSLSNLIETALRFYLEESGYLVKTPFNN